jgi:redox-sensitive bicupin YhaK (pirin superfamily)
MSLRNETPFLMLDHFNISPGAVRLLQLSRNSWAHRAALQGFPDHPHRGQATVTYMLEGCVGSMALLEDANHDAHSSFKHEDSAGHAGTIHAGGVQWMCAVRAFTLRLGLCVPS